MRKFEEVRSLIDLGTYIVPEEIDKEHFQGVVQKILSLGVSDRELANELAVAVPTIGRWASGRSCPHPLVRPPIIDRLRTIARIVHAHRFANKL